MRLLLSVAITLLTLASCRHEFPAIVVAKPAMQRVSATKTWYVGISGSLPPRIDTLIIQGKMYQSAAFDSTTFTYDAQDRLIRVNALQLNSYGSAYPGDPATTTRNARWTTYTYQGTKLQINRREQAKRQSQQPNEPAGFAVRLMLNFNLHKPGVIPVITNGLSEINNSIHLF